jgi:hypothetical protein
MFELIFSLRFQCGNGALGDFIGGPAITGMHRPHRAVLVKQEDLVLAHREDLPRYIRRAVAHQEAGHRRDLGGCHLLDLFDPRLLILRVGLDRRDHPAPGKGRDAVGAHVPALEVQRHRFREGGDTQLGGGIVRLGEVADQPRGRSHMHQRAAFLFAEIVSGGAAGVEGTV